MNFPSHCFHRFSFIIAPHIIELFFVVGFEYWSKCLGILWPYGLYVDMTKSQATGSHPKYSWILGHHSSSIGIGVSTIPKLWRYVPYNFGHFLWVFFSNTRSKHLFAYGNIVRVDGSTDAWCRKLFYMTYIIMFKYSYFFVALRIQKWMRNSIQKYSLLFLLRC